MGKFGKSSNEMDDDWGYPHLWKPHETPIWRNSNWIHQAVENPNSDHHSLSSHFQENNMFAASQPFLRSSGFKDIFQPQPLHAVCLDPFSIGCTNSAARPKKHAVSLSSKQVVWTRIIYQNTNVRHSVFRCPARAWRAERQHVSSMWYAMAMRFMSWFCTLAHWLLVNPVPLLTSMQPDENRNCSSTVAPVHQPVHQCTSATGVSICRVNYHISHISLTWIVRP